MTSRLRELVGFVVLLATLVAGFFHASLFGDKILSSGDVVFTTASFATAKTTEDYEPANRLLMDPVLQFEPWLEFTRHELRAGRLPLWNPLVGCGAPHLANGQSAVFDPFHIIAYLGALPTAIAWMAAARLWVAGIGMFLLARSWRLSWLARWFCGLSYPFCGFLVLWLLYPVTSVAVWMPWLFLTTDRVFEGRRFAISGLALIVGCVMLGGHVQTSAHVLLAAGLYLLWRTREVKPLTCWTVGILLGLSLAAIEILPLAAYLSRSPVWSDRAAEKVPILAVTKPRLLDAATTAFPYLYGSQRRGQPNLAKAVGVANLNESAAGFAGLVTLIWLAPAAWSVRSRNPRVRFLVFFAGVGFCGAFGLPPVVNLLRAIPVLDVADNRRLTLWLAFSLVLLGGYGIDATSRTIGCRGWILWTRSWFVLAILLAIGAVGVVALGPRIRVKSLAHYAQAAEQTPGANPAIYQERAERQSRMTVTFLPRYYLFAAAHLLTLAGLAELLRRQHQSARTGTTIRAILVALALADLLLFGYDLNPAIPRDQDRPDSPIIDYLRQNVPPPLRILAVAAELPPNLLMRYGLAEIRNYDSIELTRNLSFFRGLYEAEPDRRSMQTSRRTILWNGVERSLEQLKLAGVAAIIGATPPPRPELFSRVDRVGRVWIARLNFTTPLGIRVIPGEIWIDLGRDPGQVGWIAETFDPGWKAEVDGQRVSPIAFRETFLGVPVSPDTHRVVFRYEPLEVRIAAILSLLSLFLIGILAYVERSPKKRVIEAWNQIPHVVRIEPSTIARPPLPGFPSTEGRDADGPLHV